MVSRRYLRIKVFQALYALEKNPSESTAAGEKKLTKSIEQCYTLFVTLFSIFPQFKKYRLNKMEDFKRKLAPTADDLNPNTKFVDNLVIEQIENNLILQKLYINHKVHWTIHTEFVSQIFKEILETDFYQDYMANPDRSYEEDKKLVLKIIEETFNNSAHFHWFFEDKNVHWGDDLNEALLMLYKNISSFKESQATNAPILPLYKDPVEDVGFYKSLYSKTIHNGQSFFELIEPKLQNWEAERVHEIDMILMKMALCEITQFPTIPIKVTINEYIELAKWYSSAKSGLFINGMLDKLIVDLVEKNMIHKTGFGLINN
ncbi:MAG: transcription antitermination protein NusB [Bacteroidales bacterium]|nr:transcription antitermination protein NusB [Bacteroidales bacterium]